MNPCFIPLEFHKFQICGQHGCDCDAARQCSVSNTKGETYYLGTCEAHASTVQPSLELLKGRTSPHTLAKKKKINIEELFIQPSDKEERCKFLQWEKFLEDPDYQEPPPQPPEEIILEAPEEWEWLDNHKWWMSVEGEPLHMSKLESDELICAVLAVRQTNFSKITKRIEWTRNLRPEGKHRYRYPEDKLNTGYRVAGQKLEEFEEVLKKRGLI